MYNDVYCKCAQYSMDILDKSSTLRAIDIPFETPVFGFRKKKHQNVIPRFPKRFQVTTRNGALPIIFAPRPSNSMIRPASRSHSFTLVPSQSPRLLRFKIPSYSVYTCSEHQISNTIFLFHSPVHICSILFFLRPHPRYLKHLLGCHYNLVKYYVLNNTMYKVTFMVMASGDCGAWYPINMLYANLLEQLMPECLAQTSLVTLLTLNIFSH